MKKFSPHLKIAKNYWKNFLEENHVIIDATCGNGHDSLFISQILNSINGKLFCFDIQKKAIDITYLLLKNNLTEDVFEKIVLINDSHENFSEYINTKVNLVIYNLGYLPKSDKTLTTKVSTTLSSIKAALNLLDTKGAISITSYSGHPEGEAEENALLSFLCSLDNSKYNVCYHKWINKDKAPSLFWIETK